MKKEKKAIRKTVKYFIKIIMVCSFLFQPFSLSAQLVNPNATPEALRVKAIMDSVYGKKIISGQMDEKYLSYIQQNTGGKSPAIMGYDFNGICPSQSGNHDADKAIRWVKEKGGIVQFNWHWISPDADGDWSSKTFKLDQALADTSGSSYKNLIRDMDLVAMELKRMQDSGIAVLWRPLHEAEGAWFWWGMSGGEACKKLYRLMYDRFVNHFGINNLIWVWNSYGKTKPNWYPGNDVVDIISYDYPDYSAAGSWSQYREMFGDSGKLFGIGEDGLLTDPGILNEQPWLYFMTWAYMINVPGVDNGKNPKEWLFQVYNDSRVLTLSDLQPGPKAYAGRTRFLFDMNSDSTEVVTLNGSESYAAGDSVISYSWTEDTVEIATGVSPQVSLKTGRHVIKLTVKTRDGLTLSSYVVVTIKAASLTLNKPFEVSSTESGLGNLGQYAIDGNLSTRWSSAYSEPQWYRIDLGERYAIHEIIIYWQNSAAKKYRIEESNDGENWTSVASFDKNISSGARTDKFSNLQGGARYIRINCINRTTSYGFSIFEIEAFGSPDDQAEPVAEPDTEPVSGILHQETGRVSVYPTIVGKNESLTIHTANLTGKEVVVMNITGSVIKTYIAEDDFLIIPADHFQKGMYLIRVSSPENLFISRFIVE